MATRKNPRVEVKPLKKEWIKGQGLQYKPLRDYTQLKKHRYWQGRALEALPYLEWVGCVVNPKMMRPYFVGVTEPSRGKYVIYVPTTDLKNVEIVGSGYFETSSGDWGIPADQSGYPRIHTPSGVAEKQTGLGTVLYTGGCLVGSSMVVASGKVRATVSGEDGREYSVIIDAQERGWRRRSTDVADYDFEDVAKQIADRYGVFVDTLDADSFEIDEIELGGNLESEHLQNQGCSSALGDYNPAGSKEAQAWWSDARRRGLVVTEGYAETDSEDGYSVKQEEISIETTMSVDFDTWYDNDSDVKPLLGDITEYAEYVYDDPSSYGFSSIESFDWGRINSYSGSGSVDVDAEVRIFARTIDGEDISTAVDVSVDVSWDADDNLKETVDDAAIAAAQDKIVEAVKEMEEGTVRENPYLRRKSGEAVTQRDLLTGRESRMFLSLSELTPDDILLLQPEDFTLEEFAEFSARTEKKLDRRGDTYFDHTDLFKEWLMTRGPFTTPSQALAFVTPLVHRAHAQRLMEQFLPAYIAAQNEIPVESIDLESISTGEDWEVENVTFERYAEAEIEVSGTVEAHGYGEEETVEVEIVTYPIENALKARLVLEINEILSEDHGESLGGKDFRERVLNLDFSEVEDPEIFRFFFGLVEHLGATQSQLRGFQNRVLLRSDLPRGLGEESFVFDPELGFVPGLRERGIRANPEELDFQAIGRELYGDLADLD